MPKKHRVKRQKYVDHLRQLEKDRESYLGKRRLPKRSREARDDEEAMSAARDRMESSALKKRRTEAAERPLEAEEVDVPTQRRPTTATTTSTANTVAGAPKKDFFSIKPFSELAKASASAAAVTPSEPSATTAADTPATAAATKKTLKRRHY